MSAFGAETDLPAFMSQAGESFLTPHLQRCLLFHSGEKHQVYFSHSHSLGGTEAKLWQITNEISACHLCGPRKVGPDHGK